MAMWAISAMGVIFLNLIRTFSRHEGIYLSNRITRLVFSDAMVRLSIQLVT